MSVTPIVTVPNEILTKPCEEITVFGKETTKLAKDLVDTVLNAKDPEGAGLAAPQIGILKKACVVTQFLQELIK